MHYKNLKKKVSMKEFIFHNRVERDDFTLGIAHAKSVNVEKEIPLLKERSTKWQGCRKEELTKAEENTKSLVRSILRNGKYRPNGRGKPSSEYLLGAARKDNFPQINAAVDTINYLSLKHLVPISIWDVDLAGSKEYSFQIGQEKESYVFNQAGQEINLKDLLAGFALEKDQFVPIVNPVKDCLRTKTTPQTQEIIMAVYYPLLLGGQKHLQEILDEFQEIFQAVSQEPITLAIF